MPAVCGGAADKTDKYDLGNLLIKIRSPVSEEEVSAFEAEKGIRLPGITAGSSRP